MRRILIDFEQGRARELARSPHSWMLFVPGTALVGLGLAIYLVPTILITLVAGALIALGTMLLLVAWRLRRMQR